METAKNKILSRLRQSIIAGAARVMLHGEPLIMLPLNSEQTRDCIMAAAEMARKQVDDMVKAGTFDPHKRLTTDEINALMVSLGDNSGAILDIAGLPQKPEDHGERLLITKTVSIFGRMTMIMQLHTEDGERVMTSFGDFQELDQVFGDNASIIKMTEALKSVATGNDQGSATPSE